MSALHQAPPCARAVPLLARGQVRHRRLRPADHGFAYPSYFLLLPMRSRRAAQAGDEAWAAWQSPWGLSFADRDHGEGGHDALAWLEGLLQQEGVQDADGEVWLQTFPRVLGYAFKPVSFWYAHRHDGSLAAIVAEVNNTFGERHAYLLQGDQLGWGRDVQARKVFHVSPFCRVEGHYRFRFMRTDSQLVARVELHDATGPLLLTSVSGQLEPLTRQTARSALLGVPLMTFGVLARIHWQALKLWRKRVPFFHKPAAPERFVTR